MVVRAILLLFLHGIIAHTGTGFKPVKWVVPGTVKDGKPQTLYSLCGCKYTTAPPYCNADHIHLPMQYLKQIRECSEDHEKVIKLCTAADTTHSSCGYCSTTYLQPSCLLTCVVTRLTFIGNLASEANSDTKYHWMATAVLVGAGVAGAAFAARLAIRAWQSTSPEALKASASGRAFLRGGFEAQMSRREAAQILGIRENVPKDKLKEAHRRIMLLNHPDRGGSPYLASKINEAKEMLDRNTPSDIECYGGLVAKRVMSLNCSSSW
ncbi:hypothetical protein SeMB42_g06272 [Synchytrium endobioticum]|uniref:Mitochondrial import inner membrane translocase subunit TIM14 n=1 Tax=Synchytrium endobioticum TaxID=286115 RepID=A0A507CJP8_9FUNG|nr:hypothetical protein SeMB42_g06272 [Synchytrium endobioticum]